MLELLTFVLFTVVIVSTTVTQISDIPDQSVTSDSFRSQIPILDYSTTLNSSTITQVVGNQYELPQWYQSSIYTNLHVVEPLVLQSNAVDLHVENGLAFVTMFDSMKIYDISAQFNLISEYLIEDCTNNCRFFTSCVQGNFALFGGGKNGWWLVDISDVKHPKLVSRSDQNLTKDVFLEYPYAFILNEIPDEDSIRNVMIIDLRNNYTVLASIEIEDCESDKFYISNNYIFMFDRDIGLEVYEILFLGESSTKITKVSIYGYECLLVDLFFLNGDSIVTLTDCYGSSVSKIELLKFSTKTKQLILSSSYTFFSEDDYYSYGNPVSIEVVGSLAIASFTDSFQMIDLSNPSNLSWVENIKIGSRMMFICSSHDETLYQTASSYENYIVTLCEKSLSLHSFGDLFFRIVEDVDDCDRAYEVKIISTDLHFNPFDKNSSLEVSFVVNHDCTPGPSIMNELENQTAYLSEVFELEIPFDSSFYGTNLSSVTLVVDYQFLPDWITETQVSTIMNDLSPTDCPGYSITRNIYVLEDPKEDVKHLNVFVAETACLRILKYSLDENKFVGSSDSRVMVKAIRVVADDIYAYMVTETGDFVIYDVIERIQVSVFRGLNLTDLSFLSPNDNFMVFTRSTFPYGVVIMNITDRAHPNIIQDFPSNHPSYKVVVVDHELIIFMEEHQIRSAILFDSSELDECWSINGTFIDFVVQSNFLFLWSAKYEERGLYIYEFGFDFIPPNLASFTHPMIQYSYNCLFVYQDYLLLGSEIGNYIDIIDISDPQYPWYLGTSNLVDLFDLTISDIYFTNGVIFSACYAGMGLVMASSFSTLGIRGTPVPGNCDDGVVEINARDFTGGRTEIFGVSVHGCVPEKKNDTSHDGNQNEFWKSYGTIVVSVGVVTFCSFCCCCALLFCLVSFSCISLFLICGFGGICFTTLSVKGSEANEDYLPISSEGGVSSSVNDSDVSPMMNSVFDSRCIINFKRIKLQEVIGAGGGGAVIYKAKWRGKVVCIKMFKAKELFKDLESKGGIDNNIAHNLIGADFEREIKLMTSLFHPNILRSFGCVLREPQIGIVMEYCQNGDLEDCIIEGKLSSFTESMRVIREISSGMSFLHEKSIIHRDLKPKNVLLDRNFVVKIMDFGLSRTASDSSSMTRQIGTSYFMAPELVREDISYSYPVDVFAFSILVFIVLTKNVKPYGDKSGFRIEMRVCSDPNFRPEMDVRVEEELRKKGIGWLIDDVMKKGWAHEPSQRLSFGEIEKMFDSYYEGQEKKEDRKKDDFFVEEDFEIEV